MNVTEDQAKKLIEIISHGLIKGAGKEPIFGEICIEQAVTIACNLPFSDNPEECVEPCVSSFKRRLNDHGFWINNQTRAKGLIKLGLAQLGSKGIINCNEFNKLLFDKINSELLVQRLEYIPNKNRIPEHNELINFLRTKPTLKDRQNKFENNNHYNRCYYDYYYFNNYKYYYYYNYYYHLTDEQRIKDTLLIAKVGLDTLIELNSPGVKFLSLLK